MKAGEIRTQATAVIQARADDSTPGAPPSPPSPKNKVFILLLLVRNVQELCRAWETARKQKCNGIRTIVILARTRAISDFT